MAAPASAPTGPPSAPTAAPVAAPVAAPPVVRSGWRVPHAASANTTAAAAPSSFRVILASLFLPRRSGVRSGRDGPAGAHPSAWPERLSNVFGATLGAT